MLGIITGSNNINKETSSTKTRGEKSIGVDCNGSDVYNRSGQVGAFMQPKVAIKNCSNLKSPWMLFHKIFQWLHTLALDISCSEI